MIHIRRINEGEYGDIPIPTGYLAPNNSIPHIPSDFFNNKEVSGTIISKRIVGDKYLMTIKFDSGLEEISFRVDKYMNHKIGDEIKTMKTNESESMMDNVYFLSDALIMAFQDGDISIEEIELMKGYGPEESILRSKGHNLNLMRLVVENVVFCMGYTLNDISRKISTDVDNTMNLCLIYNSTRLSPVQIERVMSRFYRRIVRFGWAKIGDKAKKNGGTNTLLNIRLEKLDK